VIINDCVIPNIIPPISVPGRYPIPPRTVIKNAKRVYMLPIMGVREAIDDMSAPAMAAVPIPNPSVIAWIFPTSIPISVAASLSPIISEEALIAKPVLVFCRNKNKI